MNILNVQSSASMDRSLTRKLSISFLENLRDRNFPFEVNTLDLVTTPPPFISPEWISGAFSKSGLTNIEQKALAQSNEYIEQIKCADLILLGAPMYNYGMPASLKAWFDQIARINHTFSFDLNRGDFPIEPILKGKSLVLMTSSGEFGFEKGGIREYAGHLVSHIKACAHYLGVDYSTDLHHIGIEYQEFKDERHQLSLEKAFRQIPILINKIISNYNL